jgi:hypothetical protein
MKNLTGRPEIYGTVIMEVQITSEAQQQWSPPSTPAEPPSTMNPREVRRQRSWAVGGDERSDPPNATSSNQSHFETICTSNSPPKAKSASDRVRSVASSFLFKLRHLDPIKLAYLRTSFIFAISVLVTWTPSSINRVYNLVYPNRVSFGLNVASAVVLPLQGVWNAIIYFTTSSKMIRDEYKQFRARCEARRLESRATSRGGGVATEVIRGDRFGHPSFGRSKVVSNHDGSEMELSGQIGTVRAMRGSF